MLKECPNTQPRNRSLLNAAWIGSFLFAAVYSSLVEDIGTRLISGKGSYTNDNSQSIVLVRLDEAFLCHTRSVPQLHFPLSLAGGTVAGGSLIWSSSASDVSG
jgi:hypothetical protein